MQNLQRQNPLCLAGQAGTQGVREIKWLTQGQRLDWTGYDHILVDAEWDGKGESSFLSKQFTARGPNGLAAETLILWHAPVLPTSIPAVGHPVYLLVCPPETVLMDVVELSANQIQLGLFFSPRDVEATLGRETWRSLLADPKTKIKKLRNLTGIFKVNGHEVKLVDWAGAFNSSLETAFEAVGVDNPFKGLVTGLGHDKAAMGKFFAEYPNEALAYAMGDTIYLAEASMKRIEQVADIIEGALGFRPDWTLDSFPRSSGSLVAKTFEAWLMNTYPDLYRGVLSMSNSPNNKRWKDLDKYLAELREPTADIGTLNKQLRREDFLHGLAQGSIKSWGFHSHHSTGLFNSIVMGGRCVNEEPYEDVYRMRISNVVDIDLSSCYGSALRDFDYPIGLPTITQRRENDREMPLGQWLDRQGDRLVSGLWQVLVEGNLSFAQDLIHSKYELSTDKIARKIVSGSWDNDDTAPGERESDSAHIGGNFLLTRKQLENGIITSDVLRVLQAVCSDREWAEIKKLKVVTAAFYPADLEVTPEEWTALVLNPQTRGGLTQKGDSRTRAWCRLPLAEFIGKFISHRSDLKKQSRDKGDSYDLQQNAVKLFVNTTYGDLAAPFFPMGNTILANNITAKARTGVWMLSKALLTVQSITDGGMFSFDRVAVLDGDKRPGLSVLADRQTLLAHRSVQVERLGDGRDWFDYLSAAVVEGKPGKFKVDKALMPALGAELDAVCLAHIDRFWGHYGLELPFAIECKYENTARQAVYFSAADYRIDGTICRETVVKCRGAREELHPKQLFLAHLADPANVPVPVAHFSYTQLIGVTDWQKNPGGFGDAMPGEEQTKETCHRPYRWGAAYDTYTDWHRNEGRIKKDTQRAIALEKVLTPEERATYRTALSAKLHSST